MDNELISREWLKDAFDNLCCHDCKKCRNFNKEESFYRCGLIDNAPTVEVLTYTDIIEANKEGYNTARRLYERPKGEWIELNERIGIGEDNIYTSFKCPFCGYIDLLDNHYCGNCGADMRGK